MSVGHGNLSSELLGIKSFETHPTPQHEAKGNGHLACFYFEGQTLQDDLGQYNFCHGPHRAYKLSPEGRYDMIR